MTDIVTPLGPWRDRPMRTRAIEDARAAVQLARQRLLALLRDEVLWRDGPDCHYCGTPTVIAGTERSKDRTVDHKLPVDRGGRDELDNLVLACRACNSAKGTLPYDVFIARRRPLRIHVLGVDGTYHQGQRVAHGVFGEGIVVQAEGRQLIVAFGNGRMGR